MYVGVIHRIKDPQAMMKRGEGISEPANTPPGVRALQFFPAKSLDSATCLWEAPSVESLRDYIDGKLGDASENSYFEVDTRHALGLPAQAAAQS